jgi:hypothetical protein
MLPNHALGFLSVSRTSVQDAVQEEIELRLQMLVQMALTTLLRFEDGMVMPPEMKFSKREREILKWTAEGKTSAEIAIISPFQRIRLTSIRRICRKIQCTQQNPDCLLRGGNGTDLREYVLRDRRADG